MKKELLTILCMTLVCASVMLGIMGLYRIAGAHGKQNRLIGESGVESTAFKNSVKRSLF